MNITYECVASVTMLFILGNLLFGFCPTLLPIRRGNVIRGAGGARSNGTPRIFSHDQHLMRGTVPLAANAPRNVLGA